MDKLTELKKRRAALLGEAKAIQDAAKAEERDFTEEEAATLDEKLTAVENIDAEIKSVEAATARRARLAKALQPTETPVAATVPTTSNRDDSFEVIGHASLRDNDRYGFANFAEFARATIAADPQAAHLVGRFSVDERLRFQAATGASMQDGPSLGYAIPPSFSTAIWDGMRGDNDNLINSCDTYTVEGESLTIPANAETNRGAGYRYGGVRAYWIGEAVQMTASAPKLRQMKLEPQQLAVLIYVTDKLLKNSPMALEQYLTRAATSELVFMSSDAIINGNGVGQPKGILSSSAKVAITAETGQAAATIVPQNIVKMYAAMPARLLSGAAWYYNQGILPQLLLLRLTDGVDSWPVFMPPGGLSGAPYGTILGRPAMPIEYCQALGTEGDLIFANLKAYAVGLRGGVDQAMSMHLKFDYAETAFRFMYEIDGQSWLHSYITPFKGSNYLSPFVTLATRS